MSIRQSRAKEPCAYCGSTKDLTRDHIPPKCLFVPPRPSNLITVPACRQCNKGADLDDEYFRVFLAVGEAAHASPIGRALWGSTVVSLKKSTKHRFASAIRSCVKPVEVRSEGGILLETRKGFEADLTRIKAVPNRIIRGLFFAKTGFRLPAAHRVRVIYEQDPASQKLLEDPRIESCLQPLADAPAHTVVDGLFAYKYIRVAGKKYESVWALCFLSEALFFGFTYAKNANVDAKHF